MIGLFLCALLRNIKPAKGDYKKGTTYATKKLLKFGIILSGAKLNFNAIIQTGGNALPLITTNICILFLTDLLICKALGVSINTRRLVSSGTAISDTSSVVDAGDTFTKLIGISSTAELPVISKLTRTTFLDVVAIVFIVVVVNEKRKEAQLVSANALVDSSIESKKSFGKIIMDVFPGLY